MPGPGWPAGPSIGRVWPAVGGHRAGGPRDAPHPMGERLTIPWIGTAGAADDGDYAAVVVLAGDGGTEAADGSGLLRRPRPPAQTQETRVEFAEGTSVDLHTVWGLWPTRPPEFWSPQYCRQRKVPARNVNPHPAGSFSLRLTAWLRVAHASGPGCRRPVMGWFSSHRSCTHPYRGERQTVLCGGAVRRRDRDYRRRVSGRCLLDGHLRVRVQG